MGNQEDPCEVIGDTHGRLYLAARVLWQASSLPKLWRLSDLLIIVDHEDVRFVGGEGDTSPVTP